ncbi:DNA repair protein RecO, partial [Paracoccus aestuarii]
NLGDGLVQGLAITGHFLEHRLAPELVGRPLPAARGRLMRGLAR